MLDIAPWKLSDVVSLECLQNWYIKFETIRNYSPGRTSPFHIECGKHLLAFSEADYRNKTVRVLVNKRDETSDNTFVV